jgi:ligand-binding SRPBCC domain-containing protein
MPSFKIQTKIDSSISQVWSQFNEELLKKISPPFPSVQIIRFDGCSKGDLVILEINLLILKVIWSSQIISFNQDSTQFSFVDEGIQVPFGIKKWKHEHSIIKIDEMHCYIQDLVTFKTSFVFLDLILFPFLWGMIFYRKPFYKKYLTN